MGSTQSTDFFRRGAAFLLLIVQAADLFITCVLGFSLTALPLSHVVDVNFEGKFALQTEFDAFILVVLNRFLVVSLGFNHYFVSDSF
jgi:hypothetical protein